MKEYGFRRTPTDYTHCLEGRGSFGYISTVDAFYLDDGNPVAEHAVNQAYRLLLETVEHARSEELKSLLQLEHPNILQYIVIGYPINRSNQDNHYCLLMEWCSGITLRNFIERNPTHCSTKRIVTYTFQVASALHYLHEGNKRTKFVHGNITSSNIMMKESTGENVKIIDIEGAFQQPRGKRQSKKQFNVEGSFYFMSPEMAAWLDESSRKVTRPTPDSPTDIYSLGCVIMDMYFASQGQTLWPDYNDDSIRSAMQSEHPLTPRIPENLPDDLKDLSRQCLQVNPSDRPTAAILENYFARVRGNPRFKCAEHGIQWYIPSSKKLLGQSGSFGVVHRVDAFWIGANLVEQGKKHLALKIFHGRLDEDKDKIKKLETTLLELNHPNIVKYLAVGFFEDDGQFRIIMECCNGGTLTEAAAAKPALPIEMQKNYVNQLIQGIQYLHEEANIIHKDLKGTNVVFWDEIKSTLKICDIDSYSVRRRVGSRTFISRPGGTEGFTSPEMLACWNQTAVKNRYHQIGRATDIWSLGAVVLEMYCNGKLIMPKQETVNETFHSDSPSIPALLPLSMDRPIIPENMQEDLMGFVSKCMALKPKDRPAIKELQDEFSERFSSPSSSARRKPWLHPDKNKAPGSGEAFKIFGKTYAVLCIPQKKSDYDAGGKNYETVQHNLHFARQQGRRRYYCSGNLGDDASAHDIFNMFFGQRINRFAEHDENDGHRHGVHPRRGDPNAVRNFFLSGFSIFFFLGYYQIISLICGSICTDLNQLGDEPLFIIVLNGWTIKIHLKSFADKDFSPVGWPPSRPRPALFRGFGRP